MSHNLFIEFDRTRGYPTSAEWRELIDKAKAQVRLHEAALGPGEPIDLAALNDQVDRMMDSPEPTQATEITVEEIDSLPEARRPR